MMFPTALEMKELTRTPLDNDTILRLAVLNAIYSAASANLTVQGSVTTNAISTGSASEGQILDVLGQLRQKGLHTVLSTGSFTVTWQR